MLCLQAVGPWHACAGAQGRPGAVLASGCTQGPGRRLLGPSLVFETQGGPSLPQLITQDNGAQACPPP